MKVKYAIHFEDFCALQPPFTTRAGHNAGFKGVVVACALIGLLGVFCMARGFGMAIGGFLIGLGVLAATGAYFLDVRSVRAAKEKYETTVSAAYQRIHCREDRTFQADEHGFTLSCKCGALTHPWSELVKFSENKTHFFLGTNMDGQVVPKSAFPSEGDITEFRALISGKLNHSRPLASPHFDFVHKREDYFRAYLLHTLKAGGWRSLLKNLVTYACIVFGLIVIWNSAGPPLDVAVKCGVIGGFFGIFLPKIMKLMRKPYLGPLRIYFSEDGLYLQNPGTLARSPWAQCIGYLEDDHLVLLYYNPKLYRIIPKRALTGQSANFCALVGAKLPRYNYRHPLATPVQSKVEQIGSRPAKQ